MKKATVLCVLCILLLCLTSCGEASLFENQLSWLSTFGKTPRFEDQNAMLNYLNGMWLVDDYEKNSYYIFQDGQVYYTNDGTFEYELEQLMDAVLENEGAEALVQLDFQTAVNALSIQDILRSPESNVRLDPQKGLVIINEDQAYEKHIVIEANSVSIKDADEEFGVALTKLSAIADFSEEHFAVIFDAAKKEYTVPTSQFWTDTKEYGNMVKAFNQEINGWDLIEDTENTTIYESSKWVPSISGALIITDKSVTFTKKVSLLNTWNSNIEWNPTFTVLYTPADGKIMISDQDNLSLDMMLLLQYGAYAVRNFPGALEHTELYDIFAVEFNEGKYVVSGGAATAEKTINGITYKIQLGTNGTWAIVTVSANELVKLSDIIQYTQETEPEATTPFDPEPTVSSGNSKPESSLPGDGTPDSGLPSDDGTPDGGSPGNTTVCSHAYAVATCTEPKTCTLCGKAEGFAAGHSYSAATCTTPKTCNVCGTTAGTANGHTWVKIWETVYHEEQGHYEDVQVAKKVKKYRCWFCSYAQPAYETLDAYYSHFDSAHAEEANSSFFRERYEIVEEWEYIYETQWIVDKPAYSEQVVIGYQCSVCGEEQS